VHPTSDLASGWCWTQGLFNGLKDGQREAMGREIDAVAAADATC